MQNGKKLNMDGNTMIKTRNGCIHDEYMINMDEKIGNGIYGRVYLACPKDGRVGVRLVKIIDRMTIGLPLIFYHEISTMRALSHPYILQIDEVYKSQDQYYILTQYCKESLLQLLTRDPINENTIKNYFKMMIDAINYCHQQNICHRDIRLQNFLIQYTSTGPTLKLMDFSASYRWKHNMKLQRKQTIDHKIIRMTHYTSPQIIKGEEDELCDVWSLGVVLYAMVCGVFPFNGKTDRQIAQSILQGKYSQPTNITEQLKDLLKKMLCPAYERIDCEGISKHPWLTTSHPSIPLTINFSNIIYSSQYYKSKIQLILLLINIFSTKTLSSLEECFKQCDKENTGIVPVGIFQSMFKQNQDSSHSSIKYYIRMCEVLRDGLVNYQDFLYYLRENAKVYRQQNLIYIFKQIDKNRTEQVEAHKLQQQLTSFNEDLGCEVVEGVIEHCRGMGEKEITFEEYICLFMK